MARTSLLDVRDFTVGWICGLLIEYVAALNVLDEIYDNVTGTLPIKNDHNIYTLGRIGKHNVVVVCLPAESPGLVSASTVEANIRTSFPSIQFSLMVGIAGGSPQAKNDVRLGDVVIGTKVVPYGFGKTTPHGFEHTGHALRPPDILLCRVNHFKYRTMVDLDLAQLIEERTRQLPSPIKHMFQRPEMSDRLYKSDYIHNEDCDCKTSSSQLSSHLVTREPRPSGGQLVVHSGTIASGDQLMKNAQTRDEWAKRFNTLCFDMESAGLTRGALTIRAIDNYADSHKNDQWHGYAAMAAAVCAAEFLKMVPVVDVPSRQPRITNEMREFMAVWLNEMKWSRDLSLGPTNDMTSLTMNAKLAALEERLVLLDRVEESIRAVNSKINLAMEKLQSFEAIHKRLFSFPEDLGSDILQLCPNKRPKEHPLYMDDNTFRYLVKPAKPPPPPKPARLRSRATLKGDAAPILH
ncbi:purine and uridine phosphorylase [Aspergillus sclerotiicarbonarius CBS 121057]|uniref:Purine and uridine phosphorylase n=1 Tax=Aspergillus sclerotiicarbonarius (strain CBS 121057 / IBT 28362) TaxID=1448318 RepID=A0A319FLJ7_ASPSB|nr:purine and uridine phosphorylase [Aspergillus sclerotiicarbonarius CBS 121057]